MKILLISPIYPSQTSPTNGIHVRRVHLLYERLGHQVDLVEYEKASGKLDKMKNMMRFMRDIRSALQSSRHDLINVQYPFIAAIPFRFTKHHAPVVTTVHGSDIVFNTALKKMLGGFTRHLLEESTAVIAPSEYFRELLLKRYDLEPARVVSSPPAGYDGRYFYPAEPAPGSQDGLEWVGFASRIVQGKGWQVALDAFLRAAEDPVMAKVGLIFAGSGPEEDQLKERLEGLGGKLAERIQWAGNLDEEQMGDFLRNLDIFLFPTLFEESLGLVAIESMACGTPVIASELGATRGYVEESRNGFLVPAGDVEALARVITDYFRLPGETREAMRQRANASVEGYEMEKVALTLDEILQTAAE